MTETRTIKDAHLGEFWDGTFGTTGGGSVLLGWLNEGSEKLGLVVGFDIAVERESLLHPWLVVAILPHNTGLKS